MVRATLGHVHLKVRDLERAIGFYSRVLGLRVTERVDAHFAFLSGGDAHHEVALQELGPEAAGPDPHGVGLYHVAFEVPDAASLARPTTCSSRPASRWPPSITRSAGRSTSSTRTATASRSTWTGADRPAATPSGTGRSRRLTREALREAAGLAAQGVTGPPA